MSTALYIFYISYHNKNTMQLLFIPCSWYESHPDTILVPQNHIQNWYHRLWSVHRFQNKLGKDAAQYCLDLQHSKLLSNAVSWSCTERKIGKVVTFLTVLWEEPLRIKSFRLRVDLRIAVEVVDVEVNGRSCLQEVATEGGDVFAQNPRNERDAGVQPEDLLDAHLHVFEVVEGLVVGFGVVVEDLLYLFDNSVLELDD
jgi:hypothetical protein